MNDPRMINNLHLDFQPWLPKNLIMLTPKVPARRPPQVRHVDMDYHGKVLGVDGC